jgi:hypothetical protein
MRSKKKYWGAILVFKEEFLGSFQEYFTNFQSTRV